MWVELTPLQKVAYRAVYEHNASLLVQGSAVSKRLPNLTNLHVGVTVAPPHRVATSVAKHGVKHTLGVRAYFCVCLSFCGVCVRACVRFQMELRKCCNHAFLVDGVADGERERLMDTGQLGRSDTAWPTPDDVVRYSGKFVLLDKLLPMLRSDGHRVLLFSQFRTVLDLVEDVVVARGVRGP